MPYISRSVGVGILNQWDVTSVIIMSKKYTPIEIEEMYNCLCKGIVWPSTILKTRFGIMTHQEWVLFKKKLTLPKPERELALCYNELSKLKWTKHESKKS